MKKLAALLALAFLGTAACASGAQTDAGLAQSDKAELADTAGSCQLVSPRLEQLIRDMLPADVEAGRFSAVHATLEGDAYFSGLNDWLQPRAEVWFISTLITPTEQGGFWAGYLGSGEKATWVTQSLVDSPGVTPADRDADTLTRDFDNDGQPDAGKAPSVILHLQAGHDQAESCLS